MHLMAFWIAEVCHIICKVTWQFSMFRMRKYNSLHLMFSVL